MCDSYLEANANQKKKNGQIVRNVKMEKVRQMTEYGIREEQTNS